MLSECLIQDLANLCVQYLVPDSDEVYPLLEYGHYHAIINSPEVTELSIVCACYHGYLDIVKYLISTQKCDWEFILYQSFKGGHMDVIEYVTCIVRDTGIKLTLAMDGACQCRDDNPELVRMVISMSPDTKFDWIYGLKMACENNNVNVARLMIEYCVFPNRYMRCMLNRMFDQACIHKSYELAELLLELADDYFDYDNALRSAAHWDFQDIIPLLTAR